MSNPTANIDIIQQVKNLIEEAKISEALKRLGKSFTKTHNDVVILKSRYKGILNDQRKGILTTEEYNKELNKVRSDIMSLIADIEEEIEDIKEHNDLPVEDFLEKTSMQEKRKNFVISNSILYTIIGVAAIAILTLNIGVFDGGFSREIVPQLNKDLYKEANVLFINDDYENAARLYKRYLNAFNKADNEFKTTEKSYQDAMEQLITCNFLLIRLNKSTYSETNVIETYKELKKILKPKLTEDIIKDLESRL